MVNNMKIQDNASIIRYPIYASPYNTGYFIGGATLNDPNEASSCGVTIISESWTSGSKSITAVEVVYSAVTVGTNTTWTVSLHSVSQSSVPTSYQPAFPAEQVWSGSTTQLTASIITTHVLDTPRVVLPNDKFVTVFKFNNWGGGASVSVRGHQMYTALQNTGFGLSTDSGSTFVGGTAAIPSIRFLCSDNTYVYYNGYTGMSGALPGTPEFNADSTGTGLDSGDERGVLWIPKKSYMINSAHIIMRFQATSTSANVNLYKDNTLLAVASYQTGSSAIGATIITPVYPEQPVRVNPGDNIRLTVQATSPSPGNLRWARYIMQSPEDKEILFGGPSYETNLSITNRVDTGSWNTPVSASFAFVPVQFFGYELTGSALLSGSFIVSGSVTQLGMPVEGAIVRATRQSDNITISTSSNASGYYQFNLASGSYHASVEYQFGGQKYNALSKWDIGAV